MQDDALIPVEAGAAEPAARRGVAHALQALRAIVMRELLKFSQQTGRLVSALVRPLLWLAVFAAGFRNVFGVAIVEPYDTYIPYDVYIAPGLVGMVLLFNGMQSSLAMVYDREMGLMRLLLTAPLPRCLAAVLQALRDGAAVGAAGAGLRDRRDAARHRPAAASRSAALHALLALVCGALMLGALGPAAVGAHQAARELRRHDELRDLPDVLPVHRALPAVEAAGVGRRVGLPAGPLQPVHARGRVDPLRAVRQGPGRGALGRARLPGGVLRAGLLGLRPAARLRRIDEARGGGA